MKTILRLISTLAVAGFLVSCGDSSGSKQPQAPDLASQPEAQTALFLRTCERLKGLIANKDYKQAQETLNLFKNYKLTPDQQKIVDELQAQIPKAH